MELVPIEGQAGDGHGIAQERGVWRHREHHPVEQREREVLQRREVAPGHTRGEDVARVLAFAEHIAGGLPALLGLEHAHEVVQSGSAACRGARHMRTP